MALLQPAAIPACRCTSDWLLLARLPGPCARLACCCCRNSKLTFRLQDALGGGNSKLLVIACISSAKDNLAGESDGPL
jgi:hypothetical protein